MSRPFRGVNGRRDRENDEGYGQNPQEFTEEDRAREDTAWRNSQKKLKESLERKTPPEGDNPKDT